ILIITGHWVLWSLLFRGGYAFWRGGLALRRMDGRRPSRLQCAWRALLVWGPVAALLCLANVVAEHAPHLPVVYFAIWGIGVVLFPLYALLAIAFPNRSLHDYLAGTCLVPE